MARTRRARDRPDLKIRPENPTRTCLPGSPQRHSPRGCPNPRRSRRCPKARASSRSTRQQATEAISREASPQSCKLGSVGGGTIICPPLERRNTQRGRALSGVFSKEGSFIVRPDQEGQGASTTDRRERSGPGACRHPRRRERSRCRRRRSRATRSEGRSRRCSIPPASRRCRRSPAERRGSH